MEAGGQGVPADVQAGRQGDRPRGDLGGTNSVSIVRVGLAETKNFADGYDAIFGGKKPAAAAKAKTGKVKAAKAKAVAAAPAAAAKKKTAKKKAAK